MSVDTDEVASLIRVMKEYVKCELMQVSNFDLEDVLASMLCLLGIADEVFFSQFKNKNPKLMN